MKIGKLSFLLFLLTFPQGCEDPLPGLASGGELLLRGERPEAHFGASVSLLGDLNGDGYADSAVGAPGDDRNGAEAGAVYIYMGSATGPSTDPDVILLGGPGDRFGQSRLQLPANRGGAGRGGGA